MLGVIAIFLVLFFSCFFFATYFNKKSNDTIPLTFFLIIFIMYIFGLIQLLKPGVYIITIVFVVLFILSIVKNLKDRTMKKTLGKIFTPGFLIFSILFIVILFINYNKIPYLWDEFSHWADTVKVMFTINDFGANPIGNSDFQSYPPAMSLLQYYIMSLNFEFKDFLIFFVYQIFALSLFLPFTKKLKFKNVLAIILILGLIFVVPTIFFQDFYNSCYIDPILAMIFGYSLAVVYSKEKYDKFKILELALCLFTLVLTKDVGLLLSGILFVVVTVDLIFTKERLNKKEIIKILSILLLSLIFAKGSWMMILKLYESRVVFDQPIKIFELVDELLGKTSTYRMEVIKNFGEALCNTTMLSISNLSFSTMILVFMVLLIFICMINFPEKDRSKFSILGIIFLGLLGYIFIHMILYCFKFSEYEALKLASFERYIGIYFQAILTFISMIFINQKKYDTLDKEILVLTFILMLTAPYKNILSSLARRKVAASYYTATQFIDIGNELNEITNEESDIYVIIQESNGYEWYALKYYLRPNKIYRKGSWSLGNPYYEGDLWTKNIAYDEVEKAIFDSDYDYVLVYKSNDGLIDGYGDLFENKDDIKDKAIFEIDEDSRKLILVN